LIPFFFFHPGKDFLFLMPPPFPTRRGSGLYGFEGDEGDGPRAFDRQSQESLVMSACPRDATGKDLALLGDETSQSFNVLIINHFHSFNAKSADLPLGKPPDRRAAWARSACLIPSFSSLIFFFWHKRFLTFCN
jgi:hypothetical protein